MKICFIPGFACRATIFKSVLNYFEEPFCVDWSLDSLAEIDSMTALCDWTLKAYEIQLSESDAFVGHSLGGGVAFELSYLQQFRGKRVVLIDYFLTTPPFFFRNYCSEMTPQAVQEYVKAMLDANRPFFNREILNTVLGYSGKRLRDRETANGTRLAAIYGMRSENDPEQVENALELPPDMRALLDLSYIPASAHFPMIEQPKEFASTLKRVLGSSHEVSAQ